MTRFKATILQDGEEVTKTIHALSLKEARSQAETDCPDGKVVSIDEDHSKNGAASTIVETEQDPINRAFASRDSLGPVLTVIGWAVIVIAGIAGLLFGVMVAETQGVAGFWYTAIGVWAYAVSGVVLLAVGAMVTYLHRIQWMMAKDRVGT